MNDSSHRKQSMSQHRHVAKPHQEVLILHTRQHSHLTAFQTSPPKKQPSIWQSPSFNLEPGVPRTHFQHFTTFFLMHWTIYALAGDWSDLWIELNHKRGETHHQLLLVTGFGLMSWSPVQTPHRNPFRDLKSVESECASIQNTDYLIQICNPNL